MIRIIIVTLACIFLIRPAYALQNLNSGSQEIRHAKVYFYGFEVERITGIHEEEIEKIGCPYVIDQQSFLHAIHPNISSIRYQPLDVRGEVKFSPSRIYFIDRDGFVRLEKKEFILDKKWFSQEIRPVGHC